MQSMNNIHASICRRCMLFKWLRIILTMSYSAYTVNALNKVPPTLRPPPHTHNPWTPDKHTEGTLVCATPHHKYKSARWTVSGQKRGSSGLSLATHVNIIDIWNICNQSSHSLSSSLNPNLPKKKLHLLQTEKDLYVFYFWLCNTYCISSLTCPCVPQVKTHLRVKWPQRFRSKRRAWTCRLWRPSSTNCSRRRISYRRRGTSCRPNWPPLKVHTALCVSTSSSLDFMMLRWKSVYHFIRCFFNPKCGLSFISSWGSYRLSHWLAALWKKLLPHLQSDKELVGGSDVLPEKRRSPGHHPHGRGAGTSPQADLGFSFIF